MQRMNFFFLFKVLITLCIYLIATIIPLNNTDDKDQFDVDLKVLYLNRNTIDTDMQKEYKNMLVEKDTFEFLCYCDEANIEVQDIKKRVSFVAYKLFKSTDLNRESRNSLKRINNSTSELFGPKHKKMNLN